ncbi:TetR/AcrR family transcriptional regulator [Gordonia humi]|uniref:TetR/AcrR family transcriptional regulator n=1 Tax=Gordonia humi TaxID=686429 RepID=UPI00361C7179
MSQAVNRGGRPRAADRAAVARTGLRMFAERGYDAVTMTDIAEQCGIGRSTLLRYFASKADVLWDRTEDEVAALAETLRAAPRDADPIAVLCTQMPKMLTYLDSEMDLLRTQVSVIAESSSGWPSGIGSVRAVGVRGR